MKEFCVHESMYLYCTQCSGQIFYTASSALQTPSEVCGLMQTERPSENLNPWSDNAEHRGRKSHGQSQALRLLQGSVGTSSNANTLASTSAPAILSSSLALSFPQTLERLLSSGTDSVVQSLMSGSTGSSSRLVRHIPQVEDSPQSITAAASGKLPDSLTPAGATPLERAGGSSDSSNAQPQESVRRVFSDLTGQRYPNFGNPPGSRQEQQQGHPIPGQRKGSIAKPPSWPEIDSAAPAEGLLKSLSTESRQHSGMAFLGGSLNHEYIDSLADSVESITLAEA